MSPLKASFWRYYWIALRRASRDTQARTFLLKTSPVVLYLPAYLLFFIYTNIRFGGDRWTIAFYTFIFGTGAIALFFLRRSHRRQDETLKFSLNTPAPEPAPTEPSPATRQYLDQRARIIASFIFRICFETNPPDKSINPRSLQNTFLRKLDLWEKLEGEEAQLASLPNGHWTPVQRAKIAECAEHLRLLRWTLGMDSEITPLEHFPVARVRLTKGLFEQHLPSTTPMLTAWEIRVERDKAREYFLGVTSEAQKRGLTLIVNDLGAQGNLLAGAQRISELPDNELILLAAISSSRVCYASYLIDVLSSNNLHSFSEWLRNQSLCNSTT